MKPSYPCTWSKVSFVSQKDEKNKLKFVKIKIISTVPMVLFFKTTDLCTVYLYSEYADN